jgi:WD40 repeat protein
MRHETKEPAVIQDADRFDIFFSYSRQDQAFADDLQQALEATGKRCWIDRQKIQYGAMWEEEIKSAIERSASILFISSPDSAASDVCEREVGYARELRKKIVPLLHRPVVPLPHWVARINAVPANREASLAETAAAVLRAVDTDLDFQRRRADLQTDAGKWKREGRRKSLLRHGQDVSEAEALILTCRTKGVLTELEQDYVEASRAYRRQVRLSIAISFLAFVVVVGAWWTVHRQSRSRELAARAINESTIDPVEGLRRASAAEGKSGTEEARGALRAILNQPLPQRIFRYNDPLANAVFTRDGKSTISASWADSGEARVGVCLIKSGACSDVIRAKATFAPLAFDREKKWFAAAAGKSLWFWDSGTDKVEGLPDVDREIKEVALSPDGALIVVVPFEGPPLLWNTRSKRYVTIGDKPTNSLAFSMDAKRMATAGSSGVEVWGWVEADACFRREYSLPEKWGKVVRPAATRVAFSPDGKSLAIAAHDAVGLLWHFEKGADPVKLPHDMGDCDDATCEVSDVEFSSDGKRVLTAGGQDRTARLWDATNGLPMGVLRGHTNAVKQAHFSPDARSVVTASEDWTAQVWDAETAEKLGVMLGHADAIASVEFSSDGKYLVTASHDKTVRVWRSANWRERVRLKGHESTIQSAEFSPTKNHMLTASWDGTARLWNVLDGRQMGQVGEPTANGGSETWLHRAVLSPDGALAVIVGNDCSVRVWNLTSAKPESLHGAAGNDGCFKDADFLSEDTLMVIGDDGMHRWKHDDNGWQRGERLTSKALEGLRLSDDRRWVIVWHKMQAQLFDLREQSESMNIDAKVGSVFDVALRPDAKYLVVAGNSNFPEVWSVSDRRLIARLRGHSGVVYSAAFSPTGEILATGGSDGRVMLWDAETWQRLSEVKTKNPYVYQVRFSSDGSRILAAGTGNIVQVYECEVCGSVAQLAERARRNLALLK